MGPGRASGRTAPRLETDNLDQRIAEDLNLFVSGTVGLAIGGLRAVVTLVSFVAILWGLSGTITISFGRSSISLPGYIVWTALVHAMIGTWLTSRIGRRLIRLDFDQQRYEADFRFGLVRFRERAEGLALYHGEADELRERFGAVVRNFWDIMRRQKRLTWFTAGHAQAAIIFPWRAAAHRLRARPGPEARLALPRRGHFGAGRGDRGASLSPRA